MIRKIALMLFGVVLALFSIKNLTCFGSEINTIPFLQEIDLPLDLNFTANNTCSGHAYFMQAAADENGCFAVYSRHVDPNDDSKVDFKKAYIDIYQSDGSFFQELSFTTSLDLAFEIKNNAVNVYFYDSVLVYDLVTQELHHYAIPNGAAVNNGLYSQLRSKEFTAGNWVYSCKQGLNGYTELTRGDSQQVQVLLEMPSSDVFLNKVILPGGAIGIITMVITLWWFKKKRKKPGDGSLS